MPNKKLLKFLVKLAVSLFFVWWIIFKVNWSEVGQYLKKLDSYEIILYIIFYLGGIIISSYKWQFLAQLRGIVLPLSEFFKSYFSATFINNFMPSFVGGDSYKVYRIGKLSAKFKEAASSVIVDRLSGLMGGMVLVVIFSVLNLQVVLENEILLILNSLALGGLIFLFIILKYYRQRGFENKFIPLCHSHENGNLVCKHGDPRIREDDKSHIIKLIWHKSSFEKLNLFINKIIAEINYYNGKASHIWKAIGLSFLFNLVGLAGANWVLFWALEIDINVLNYLSVIFLASVVSSIPISINNIGVKEWAYITFFGIFGLSASAVISVAIISRILQMLLSFLAIPIYLKNKKI